MTRLYWIALQSIWIKEITRFARIWIQTLVPPVITMSLYFVIFGNLIGARIGDMGGFDYMQFIVPGLIMMAVITNAYSNVAASFYGAKFQRSIEELLVAPVPTHIVIIGYVGGGVARGILCRHSGDDYLVILRATACPFVVNDCLDADTNGHPILPGRIVECSLCQDI
ncbi:hypothetical protein L326_0120765 [Yersinia pestis 113]|nr:hypothetical protein L326_0120765 [Yersinia pestis 113]